MMIECKDWRNIHSIGRWRICLGLVEFLLDRLGEGLKLELEIFVRVIRRRVLPMDGESVAACQVRGGWTGKVLGLRIQTCRYLPILLRSSIWGRYRIIVILTSQWWFCIVVVINQWGDWHQILKSIWLQSNIRKGWMWFCGFGVAIIIWYEAWVRNCGVQDIQWVFWMLKLLLLLYCTHLCIFPSRRDHLVRFVSCISLLFLGLSWIDGRACIDSMTCLCQDGSWRYQCRGSGLLFVHPRWWCWYVVLHWSWVLWESWRHMGNRADL